MLFSSVFLPGWGFFLSACSPGLRPSHPALSSRGACWLAWWYTTSRWIFNPSSREPGESLPLCISHPNPPRPADRDMETKRLSEDHSDRPGQVRRSSCGARTNALAHTQPPEAPLRGSAGNYTETERTVEMPSGLQRLRILST